MIEKRIIKILILLAAIFAVGISGYMAIEGWNFLDALYMTVITLFTVGYMEVNPLSPQGRVFTIFLLVVGFSVIFYGFGTVAAYIVDGELTQLLRRKKMDNKISKLDMHYIVCGAGDIGMHVISEFVKTKNPVVVIEKNEEEIKKLKENTGEILYIVGDASSDAVLKEAGIMSAKGLI